MILKGKIDKCHFIAVEMGEGDIRMLGTGIDDEGNAWIGFKNSGKEEPIDTPMHAPLKTFEEFKPQLVFIFKKRESILSVIHQLENALQTFDENNNTQKQDEKP